MRTGILNLMCIDPDAHYPFVKDICASDYFINKIETKLSIRRILLICNIMYFKSYYDIPFGNSDLTAVSINIKTFFNKNINIDPSMVNLSCEDFTEGRMSEQRIVELTNNGEEIPFGGARSDNINSFLGITKHTSTVSDKLTTQYKGFWSRKLYGINGVCHQDCALVFSGVPATQVFNNQWSTVLSMGVYGPTGGNGMLFLWGIQNYQSYWNRYGRW